MDGWANESMILRNRLHTGHQQTIGLYFVDLTKGRAEDHGERQMFTYPARRLPYQLQGQNSGVLYIRGNERL